MLVKQGDREPWDEAIAKLPEIQVPGVEPSGYDAMAGNFNPETAKDLQQVRGDILATAPAGAAQSGWTPLEGHGTDVVGSVHGGGVSPLK